MSLKADREIYITDILNVTDQASAAGQVLIYGTQPSGRGVGQGINESAPLVVPQGTGNPASGTRIAGLALQDVIDIYSYGLLADGAGATGLTNGIGDPISQRYHRNWQKTEAVVGEPVALLKDGKVWTNRVNGTPAAGDPAYLGPNSNLQPTQVNSLPQVGKFDTAKDGDGYAKVTIKLV